MTEKTPKPAKMTAAQEIAALKEQIAKLERTQEPALRPVKVLTALVVDDGGTVLEPGTEVFVSMPDALRLIVSGDAEPAGWNFDPNSGLVLYSGSRYTEWHTR